MKLYGIGQARISDIFRLQLEALAELSSRIRHHKPLVPITMNHLEMGDILRMEMQFYNMLLHLRISLFNLPPGDIETGWTFYVLNHAQESIRNLDCRRSSAFRKGLGAIISKMITDVKVYDCAVPLFQTFTSVEQLAWMCSAAMSYRLSVNNELKSALPFLEEKHPFQAMVIRKHLGGK